MAVPTITVNFCVGLELTQYGKTTLFNPFTGKFNFNLVQQESPSGALTLQIGGTTHALTLDGESLTI